MRKRVDLCKIGAALRACGIPPPLGPDESRFLIHLLKKVAKGLPVLPEQVEGAASDLGMKLGRAESLVRQIGERDGEGNLVGILGLSQDEHPHQFRISDRRLTTWCAWDSLFLPALLGSAASVASSCPATGKRIRLEVTPERAEQLDPPGMVLSMVKPRTVGRELGSGEKIRAGFCCRVHFFATREDASGWMSEKNENLTVLSVDEGFLLGRTVFRDLLEFV